MPQSATRGGGEAAHPQNSRMVVGFPEFLLLRSVQHCHVWLVEAAVSGGSHDAPKVDSRAKRRGNIFKAPGTILIGHWRHLLQCCSCDAEFCVQSGDRRSILTSGPRLHLQTVQPQHLLIPLPSHLSITKHHDDASIIIIILFGNCPL